jgi:hypothetical protein
MLLNRSCSHGHCARRMTPELIPTSFRTACNQPNIPLTVTGLMHSVWPEAEGDPSMAPRMSQSLHYLICKKPTRRVITLFDRNHQSTGRQETGAGFI